MVGVSHACWTTSVAEQLALGTVDNKVPDSITGKIDLGNDPSKLVVVFWDSAPKLIPLLWHS